MTEKIFIKTFLYVWVYIPVIFGIILLASGLDWDLALSFFLGSIVSVMLMSHNYKTTMKTAHKEPDLLKVRALKNYFFRYGFYILILAITYFKFDDVKYMIAVFVGFTTFKVVMVINFALSSKGDYTDD